MGTAARKAAKQMAVRCNLAGISANKDADMAERVAARKAHKALDNLWTKRQNSNTRGFYDPRKAKS